MSANWHGIFALTGRAHCQRQVAFFSQCVIPLEISKTLLPERHDLQWSLCFTFMFVECYRFLQTLQQSLKQKMISDSQICVPLLPSLSS